MSGINFYLAATGFTLVYVLLGLLLAPFFAVGKLYYSIEWKILSSRQPCPGCHGGYGGCGDCCWRGYTLP